MTIYLNGSFDYRGMEDVIGSGSEFDDNLSSGSGNDFLNGGSGSGNDVLSGNDGNDILSGGEGNDFLGGDSGDDALFGDSGNDILSGGAGNDILDGSSGNDYMEGGNGEDRLIGGLGNDRLLGGYGNDYINGYGSNLTQDRQFDRLTGEAGSDTFVLGEKDKVFYNEPGDSYAVIEDWNPGANSTGIYVESVKCFVSMVEISRKVDYC